MKICFELLNGSSFLDAFLKQPEINFNRDLLAA